jgi:hypothetical protein
MTAARGDRQRLWLGGGTDHLVADVGCCGGVDDADDLEFDLGWEDVEQAVAPAEQDRDLVELDLVQDAGF